MTLRLKLADRLALVALPLAAIAAIAGLLVPGIYRDTADGIRQARATDLVTLFVAVPLLAVGLWRARSVLAIFGAVTATASILLAVGLRRSARETTRSWSERLSKEPA